MSSRDTSLPRVGGWPFVLSAGFGRVPAAMVQLGVLLFVVRVGGTLTQAGAAVAVLGLGGAVAGPVIGRLIDRVAPVRIVIACTLVQLTALAGFATVASARPGWWLTYPIVFFLGAANPQIGSIARGHWARTARDRQLPSSFIGRAMGYEGAVDETSFVLGPALAGVLLGTLGALPGVITIGVCTLVAQGGFIVHLVRAGERAPRSAFADETSRIAVPWWRVAPVAIAAAAVGFTFGSTQTALTWWFNDLGRDALTGPIYGLVGVGSAISSLLIGRAPRSFPLAWRIVAGAAVLALAGVGLGWVNTVASMAIVAFVIGFAVGPVLVSSYSLAEELSPRQRLTTVMTVIATAMVLGVSSGAALTSRVIDTRDFVTASQLLVVAGVVATVMGLLARRRQR